jgi:hypothetical protein
MKARRMRKSQHTERIGERINANNTLFGISKGKRLVVKPSLRWENNTEMGFKEIIRKDMN